MSEWEAVIGLEVHVQLATETKLFSGSAVAFGEGPNTRTDPTVLGLPGALPAFNERALELALRLGVAVGGEIRPRSRFARKHYFYPDLPKGYQISQYDEPYCEGGAIELRGGGMRKTVRLTRIHMEEDAGKSMHGSGGTSLVDLNRAGIPLCEVVSEPELRSADEAAEFMRALRQLVRYLGVSDGDMEKGQLRCDANVSVRPAGSEVLGTRTELKNINSFRFVKQAIEHEIARQIRVIEGGGAIVQETRLWDADAGVSQPMRSKEEAEDYRYFPDPDLPPLEVSGELLGRVRGELPELPAARFDRLVDDYGLSEDDARTLTAERPLADYFDRAVTAFGGASGVKPIANWILAELLRELGKEGRDASEAPIAPEHLAGLVRLIVDDTISGKIGKDVFAKMYASGESAEAIVEREGLRQITDTGEIEGICREVVDANPAQAEAYRGGKDKMLGFFVGQVMKRTGGKANPKLVNEVLTRLLKGG
jgi:aspartyl-tRNA(Asn)/glutamyl-tRNA(Gln) amidotransferase subunit B